MALIGINTSTKLVVRSTDNGGTWAEYGSGFVSSTTRYTTLDKITGAIYIIGYKPDDSNTDRPILQKSTDGGLTWSVLSGNASGAFTCIDHQTGASVTPPNYGVASFNAVNDKIMINIGQDVYISHNGGTTFRRISDGNASYPNTYTASVITSIGDIYVIKNNAGFAHLIPANRTVPGASEYDYSEQLPVSFVSQGVTSTNPNANFTFPYNMAVDEGAGTNGEDVIYVGYQVALKSVDGGQSWTRLTQPNLGSLGSLYSIKLLNGRLYAGYKQGLAYWNNAEGTPVTVTTSSGTPFFSNSQISGFEQDSDGHVYAHAYMDGTYIQGYHKSTDDGATWTAQFKQVYQVLSVPEVAVNTAPSDIVLSSASLPESASIGTVVGTLTSDGDNLPLVYSLSGGLADNSAFSISGSDLVLNAALDYEAKSSYTVEVSVTDAGSNVFAKEFVISVTDVNEVPFGLALSSTSITENNSVGDIIGSLSASDPEGGALTFSIVGGADASSFSISGSQLLASEVFDFETKTSYQVQVRATDAGGLYVEGPFIVTILNSTSDDPVELQSSEVTVLSSGKAVAVVAADPREVAVTLNGAALPQGSVVKNSVSGQKFMKSAGDEFQFIAIELVPKAAWSWSADGETAWEVLQGF